MPSLAGSFKAGLTTEANPGRIHWLTPIQVPRILRGGYSEGRVPHENTGTTVHLEYLARIQMSPRAIVEDRLEVCTVRQNPAVE